MGKKKKQEKQEKLEKLKKSEKPEKNKKSKSKEQKSEKKKSDKGKAQKAIAKSVPKEIPEAVSKAVPKEIPETVSKAVPKEIPETVSKAPLKEIPHPSVEEKAIKKEKKPSQGKVPTGRSSGRPVRQNGSEPGVAEMFRALGDENRLQIMDLLMEQEMCAGDLLEQLNVVQSTLSHHMKILVDSGVVNCRKQGRWSWYSINADSLDQISDYVKHWK